MLFNAEIKWRIVGTDPLHLPYVTKAQVSALDEVTAKRTIEHEFASCLKDCDFKDSLNVTFLKIKLSAAKSNLMLISGYGA